MDRRSFLRNLAGLGAAAAAGPGALRAALGATADPVALARVRPGSRIGELASTFDLTEHGHGGWIDAVLWPGDRARLERRGFRYEILDPDLAATDLRARVAEARMQLATPGTRLTYRTLAEYETDLAALASARPDICRLVTSPHRTLEGRTVVGLEIGGPDIELAARDGRPASLICGLHHAREWPSGELPMMFAEEVVSEYDAGTPEIVDLLNAVRVFIVPVVNPDGFVRSRETISDFLFPLPGAAALLGEFAYHRKNMRPNTPLPVLMGVDPNRNYPYRWGGIGSSDQFQSQIYHGPTAGSEPCVRNIIDLASSNHIVTMITAHTYGDLVLRPWGHTSADTPDETAMRALGDAMAEINGYRSMKSIGLYPTTGTTDDWLYGATGGFGYTFEIGARGSSGLGNTTPIEGAGFHPQYNLFINSFYARNRDAFLLLLDAARDPSLHAIVAGRTRPGSTIRITQEARLPQDRAVGGITTHPLDVDTSIDVGPSGRFSWHVNPSPLPQTVTRVARGEASPDDLEPYVITATHPDGTTRSLTRVVQRGARVHVNLR